MTASRDLERRYPVFPHPGGRNLASTAELAGVESGSGSVSENPFPAMLRYTVIFLPHFWLPVFSIRRHRRTGRLIAKICFPDLSGHRRDFLVEEVEVGPETA